MFKSDVKSHIDENDLTVIHATNEKFQDTNFKKKDSDYFQGKSDVRNDS